MKRLFCAAIAPLLLSAGMANAGDKFAIGLAATQADINVNKPGINVNGEATGWRLFGEYKLNDKLSFEGGMTSYGRPDDPSLAGVPEVEAEGYDLFAVGKLPLHDRFDVIGKMGFVSLSTEVEQSEFVEASTKSTDLALGLGGEYQLSNKFSLRGEYLWTDSKNTGAQDTLAFSGIYRFD